MRYCLIMQSREEKAKKTQKRINTNYFSLKGIVSLEHGMAVYFLESRGQSGHSIEVSVCYSVHF